MPGRISSWATARHGSSYLRMFSMILSLRRYDHHVETKPLGHHVRPCCLISHGLAEVAASISCKILFSAFYVARTLTWLSWVQTHLTIACTHVVLQRMHSRPFCVGECHFTEVPLMISFAYNLCCMLSQCCMRLDSIACKPDHLPRCTSSQMQHPSSMHFDTMHLDIDAQFACMAYCVALTHDRCES